MSFRIHCDQCDTKIKEVKTLEEAKGLNARGLAICDSCQKQIKLLENFYAEKRGDFVNQLNEIYHKAEADLKEYLSSRKE